MMSEEKMFCPNCGSECERTEKFCGNCGAVITTDEKEKSQIARSVKYELKNKKAHVTPIIIDYIGYLIGVVIISVAIGIFLIGMTEGISDLSGGDSNVFQQIYNHITAVGSALGMGISAALGLIFIFVLFALSRFNNIQRQINETQDLICKQLDIINERFNVLEDKE